MTKFANRLFHIPEYSDNESNVIARLTYNAAIGLALLSLVFVIISASVAPALLQRAVIMAFMIILTSFEVMVLIQTYNLQIASILLVSMMWLIITVGAITAGGVSAPIFIGYMIVILAGGLIPNKRIGIFISLASILTGILVVIAEINGLLPPPFQYSAIARLGIYIFFFIVTFILQTEDYERVMNANHAVNMTGELFNVEYRLITKDQRVIWVKDEATLIRNESGAPQYWLGVWTDITARKHAEEEQADLVSVMTKRTIQLQTAAEVSRAASSILDLNKLLPMGADRICNHFDYYYVGIFLIEEP